MTWERYALRWISKAFEAYGIEGSRSDIVTLVCAMMQHNPADQQMSKVIPTLHRFRQILEVNTGTGGGRGSLAKAQIPWIPNYLAFDLEIDDTMAWVLLSNVHFRLGSQLRVLCQLPPDVPTPPPACQRRLFGNLTTYVNVTCQALGQACKTFTDEHSENGEAVAQHWRMQGIAI